MTPKLPTPVTVDGNRLMFTRAQMVEYGKECFAEGMACRPASGSQYPKDTSPQDSSSIDFLRGMMGMKP